MECFDVTLAMHALIGASLIVAGSHLMSNADKVGRGYGAYCFALGYLILGVAAAGENMVKIDFKSRRYLLGIGSVIAIVAGQFMVQYHVQNKISALIKGRLAGVPVLEEDILATIPVIDNILIYGGYLGLVFTIAMKKGGSFNYVKGALALGALVVIGYTRGKYLQMLVSGQDATKHQVAHILSWGLLVLAISYSC